MEVKLGGTADEIFHHPTVSGGTGGREGHNGGEQLHQVSRRSMETMEQL